MEIIDKREEKTVSLEKGDVISFTSLMGYKHIAFVQYLLNDKYVLAFPSEGGVWNEETIGVSLEKLNDYVNGNFKDVEVITDRVKLVIE